MYLCKFILALLCICFLLTASAQEMSSNRKKKNQYSSKLSIRNAFEEQSDKAEPSKASFSLPDTGKKSFLIDLGISYDMYWMGLNQKNKINDKKLSPFVVFSRNTLISKEQYSYRTGLAGEYAVGSRNSEPQNGDIYRSIHYLNATVQYQRNKIDTTHSFITTIYWSYAKGNQTNAERNMFINYYKRIRGSYFFYYIGPSAGVEFQDIFQAKDTTIGAQLRLYSNIDGRIAFRWAKKGRREKIKSYSYPKLFEITANYIPRYTLFNGWKNAEIYNPLFKTSLVYYPTFNQDFSIALSYSNGADPIGGLEKQRFWLFAVQFKK
ncbi:MAG: hypothetical protein JO154_12075 [Chitinophaga sp.]|uniref:hypothetical protein n=1 Tax=Chitinophaga sp. TaxID=1869181 RepID=UPI0025BE06BE|nr:hypothetical protein [Chitinophaga sp.]MBV8253337.1 hypothetical protein [Chitinophaga sp.]